MILKLLFRFIYIADKLSDKKIEKSNGMIIKE